MTRKTHNLVQGSDEWKAHRAKYFNASECAAMMGLSPYTTRNELLRQKHSGIVPEVNGATQQLFDDGHHYEELARPWAEEEISEELFPVSMTYEVQGLRLAASMDGLNMAGTKAWEHKTINKAIREAAEQNEIPEYIRVQIEHQLIVSGAERCLFMASAGTPDDVVELWYEGQPEIQQRILDGWKQFQADLEAYEPPPELEPELVGKTMDSLPALNLQVEAKVIATNIGAYKAHAIAVFESINTDLQTDQDFADAEKAVKFCKDIEDRLTAAKDHALSQAEDLYRALTDLDEVGEAARQKRLALAKLVKDRKEARKAEIQQQAVEALHDHYMAINATFSHGVTLPVPHSFRADVGQAMKGKRTIQSLIDSADQALADAKLAANAEADLIRANLQAFPKLAGDYEHLFADIKVLAGKQPDDFAATIKLRIAEQKEREEAQRERIRQEEEAKAKKAAEEDALKAREAEAKPVESPAPAPTAPEKAATPVSGPTEDDGATIKLGEINARLAPISITAVGLEQLGFAPVGREGSANLYRAGDFGGICLALVGHINSVRGEA